MKIFNTRFFLAAARGLGLAMVFVFGGAAAQAYTITQIDTSGGSPGGLPIDEVSELVEGDFFEVTWTLDGSGTYGGIYPDLDATAIITVTSLSATQVVLDITLSNDTAPLLGDPDLEAVITVFGLSVGGVDLGNAGNGLSSTGSNFDTYDEGNIGGGLTIDVCASTDAKCNKGDPTDGIAIGESDSFQFTLMGDFDTDNLVLGVFGTKWQTNYGDINPEAGAEDSFELPGVPTPPIPEPSTAVLLGLGLLGLSFAGRPREF